MLKSLSGTNALTVYLSPSESTNTHLFYCPYKQNIIGKYTGKVAMIQPGYDPDKSPQFFVKSFILGNYNINYSFQETDNPGESTLFWIQDTYFDSDDLRPYVCHVCRYPILDFTNNGAWAHSSKRVITKRETIVCYRCKHKHTFMGIVAIKEFTNAVSF